MNFILFFTFNISSKQPSNIETQTKLNDDHQFQLLSFAQAISYLLHLLFFFNIIKV